MYVIYGQGQFSNTNRRNIVARKMSDDAAAAGLVPSSALPDRYGPGTVSFSYTAVELDAPDLVPGTVYPAFHGAWEHPDPDVIAAAQASVMAEMQRGGWLHGELGTMYYVHRTPRVE